MTGTPTPVPQPRAPVRLASGDVTEEYLRMAVPGQGSITCETGYDMQLHQAEVEFSKWLHSMFGGNIQLLTEANQDKISTADYLWRGKLWDLKTASTEKSANSAIRHGLKQIFDNPGGIILDYRGKQIDLALLDEIIRKRLWWCENHPSIDIMIVLGDRDVQVWRYPQKK